jgi:DNA-binding transcriptional LysR family regulator
MECRSSNIAVHAVCIHNYIDIVEDALSGIIAAGVPGGSAGMDLRQLRCFVAVAEEMHFGRAAERLHVAQPALSRMLRALEDEIGATLLFRTTRAVTPTPAGLGFLADAKAILARTEDAALAARRTAAEGAGTLRIGAIDSASASLLPAAMTELRRRAPAVDMRLSETMTGPQLQMLRSGRLDLALIRPPLTATEFPFERLWRERMIALLPADHPLAGEAAISVAALAGERLVVPAKRARPYAYDLAMAWFEAAAAMPRAIQETTEKPAMLAMVAAGHGVALVPEWVATLRHAGVAAVALSGPEPDPLPEGAWVGASWRPDHRHPLRDALLAILREAGAAADGSPPERGSLRESGAIKARLPEETT